MKTSKTVVGRLSVGRDAAGKASVQVTPANAPGQGSGGEPILQRIDGAWFLLHDGPDLINRHLKAGKAWEPMTARLAKLLLHAVKQPVVLDVGANLGAFAVPVGQWLAGRDGRLVAFEPQKMVYYQLCGNLFANGLAHCEARMAALGAELGEVQVPLLDVRSHANLGGLSLDADIRRYPRRHPVDCSRTESVVMTTIDALDLPKIDLIKIDVEGLELEVLQGARGWMARHGHPHLLFEVWGDYLPAYRPKREALMRLVTKTMGYEVTMLGELCLAQHPERRALTVRRNPDNTLTFAPLGTPEGRHDTDPA